MKKWLKFFFLGFFSNKHSREGAKRGYANFLLGFILALVFLWGAYVGAELLPFGTRYNNAPDFREAVHTLLASPDSSIRQSLKIQDGRLVSTDKDGQLLINSLTSESDRATYSVNGYDVVIDLRPATTPAEVNVYCVANDGTGMRISYEEYLTLSAVARLNFDFKLEYTGNELILDSESVLGYREYLMNLDDESKDTAMSLSSELADGKITENDFNLEIYKLYFTKYYPEITEYESSSSIPLLRNYYYHEYLKSGASRYLFIFDDYLSGAFETSAGMKMSFYGFFSSLDDGDLIGQGLTNDEANKAADRFIKLSFSSILLLSLYAYAMNIFTMIPFIALMPLIVTLLTYSILKLRGIESIKTFGALFKILGSYVWFSGAAAALITVILSFLLPPSAVSALPLVLFFVVMAARSVWFAVAEAAEYKKQTEQQTSDTEA